MDGNPICYFAETDARNKRVKFGIKERDRTRHMYVIGKTGMGKSTLLENMAIQDMQRGDGIAFIDPHGKTADLLLEYVPESRIKDVLYFAPFDLEYPISFNVMEDVGMDKRHLVVSGLMSAFKKIWLDAWSARMEYILSNILLALLEYPGSTILGVNRMLADKDYRKKVVENVKDVSVRAFWLDEFAKYGDRYMQEAGAAIQNKVGQFVSNPLIRNIIGQPQSTFDLRAMMDQRKIIIVNLSKGRVGEQNANLLGSMFVTKLYLAAMSRADLNDAALARSPNFNLYVDEFQSFANESFANILSEARKYRLSLTIAHQYIEQMSEEVRAAVFGNVGTMVVFRVGAYDAEILEKEYAPRFTAEDIVNLGFAQIYLKLMIDGVTSPPFSATTLPPLEKAPVSFRDDVIEWTRRTYARNRTEVEVDIRTWSENERPAETSHDAKRKPQLPRMASDRVPDARPRSQEVPRKPISPREYRPTPVVQVPQTPSVPVATPVPVVNVAPPAVALPKPDPLPKMDEREGGYVSLKDLKNGSVVNTPISGSSPHVSSVTSKERSLNPQISSVKSEPMVKKETLVGTSDQKSVLRDALASVLKNNASSSTVTQPVRVTPKDQGANSTTSGHNRPHHPVGLSGDVHETKQRGEVSVDEVRRILDVPRPKE